MKAVNFIAYDNNMSILVSTKCVNIIIKINCTHWKYEADLKSKYSNSILNF